jgi:hypothetical protein
MHVTPSGCHYVGPGSLDANQRVPAKSPLLGCSPFGPPPALEQSCWCPPGHWRAWRVAGRWEAGWGCAGLGGWWASGKELLWSL